MTTPSSSHRAGADGSARSEQAGFTPWTRWLSGTLGAVWLGTGVTAVFITENQVGTATLLAIGVYFAIAAILGFFPRLKFGESEIDPGEFSAVKEKVGQVENEVSNLSERVAKAFLSSMSENMYRNLAKLCTGNFGHYVLSGPLERELRYLRDVGYIDVHAVAQMPKEGGNLSDWVTVTENGRNFITLRNELV